MATQNPSTTGLERCLPASFRPKAIIYSKFLFVFYNFLISQYPVNEASRAFLPKQCSHSSAISY